MKIGKLLPNGKVEKEYCELGVNHGYIYKNTEAFEQKLDEVCYVPEYTVNDDVSEGYNYQDFLDLAKETFGEFGFKGNIEKFAEVLFNSCEWQSPETLIEDWKNEFEQYPESYEITEF